MKFCKNLQRIVDISDPAWAPYWTNYKMLKKLLKTFHSVVPFDEGNNNKMDLKIKCNCCESTTTEPSSRNDEITKLSSPANEYIAVIESASAKVEEMGKSPGEITFFKLLYGELYKTSEFFEQAQEEFTIREKRVQGGVEILKRPNSIMLNNDKWSFLAKSVYQLYKDLLLLEIYAIMTYCSFSKILKKHDKVTGFDTRNAFMANVVSKANFANYPRVLLMIKRCELLYDEVTKKLMAEGCPMCDDERLFISMVQRLNFQIMNKAEAEGGLDVQEEKQRRQIHVSSNNNYIETRTMAKSQHQSSKCTVMSSLRALVEENDEKICMCVSDEQDDDDTSIRHNKKTKNYNLQQSPHVNVSTKNNKRKDVAVFDDISKRSRS